MKTLVTYSSKTGNTRKVGEAIGKVFTNVEVKDISEVDHFDYDLMIVGAWIDKGTADVKALEFIEKIKNKNIGYYFTLGASPNSQHAKDCIKAIDKLFIDNDNNLLGNYHCQGAIDPKLMEWMSRLPEEHPHAPSAERKAKWLEASKHPNQQDFESAQEVFKNINISVGGMK